MPDTTPDAAGPLRRAVDTAIAATNQLNVAVAYVPDMARRSDNLDAIQTLIAALTALRDDLT